MNKIALGIILMLVLSGCTALVHGRFHVVGIMDPDQRSAYAEVTNAKGDFVYFGGTPRLVKLPRSRGFGKRQRYVINFCDLEDECVGTDTVQFSFNKKYFLNLVNPVGWVVDPLIGSIWISNDSLVYPRSNK
jgi:hypothetical protein